MTVLLEAVVLSGKTYPRLDPLGSFPEDHPPPLVHFINTLITGLEHGTGASGQLLSGLSTGDIAVCISPSSEITEVT
jgi:hypothetical protein